MKAEAFEPGLESYVKVHFLPCQALMKRKVGQGNGLAGLIAGGRVNVVALLTHMHLTQVAPFLTEPANTPSTSCQLVCPPALPCS